MTDIKNIARNISLIENHAKDFQQILLAANTSENFKGIIGITGAPGAGKSTLTDGLIEQIILDNKKVAVLCIDPSSPFNKGALLGDRVRMNAWYNHPDVFIRSFGSRKALGGLCPMIIEITEYMKSTGFDFIIIETVGVGQNEIDIAGISDVTVLTLIPESGDDIQTMKSGVMEIADIIVVNKSDLSSAPTFTKHLQNMLAFHFNKSKKDISIVKTIADKKEGLKELYEEIGKKISANKENELHAQLLTDKAFQLIQSKRMEDVDKEILFEEISNSLKKDHFNLFRFIEKFETENKK